jgi:septal ring factor EnvC (AmiA/AmiB activator)
MPAAGKVSTPRPERIQELEEQLSSEKEKLKAFDFQEKGLLRDLAELEKEVEEKRKGLEVLKARLQEGGAEVKRLEGVLESLERRSKVLEDRIAERIVNLYKHARKGYMRALVDAENVDDLRHRVTYIRALMKEDQKILRGFADEELALRAETAAVRKRISELESTKTAEQKMIAGLRQDLEQKVLRLANVHKEKEFYETAVRELESAGSDFRVTLERIEQRGAKEVQGVRRFEDRMGNLPLPLPGRIVRGSDFGSPSRPTLHKGVFIESPSVTEVRAVFPGRVEFSGKLKGYGEVIVVNHGSRYFTVTGLLGQRLKREGDTVDEGEVVGTIGSRGEPIDRRLYFEIRRGGDNLDPLKWFKRP